MALNTSLTNHAFILMISFRKIVKGIKNPRRAKEYLFSNIREYIYIYITSLNMRYYRRIGPPAGYNLVGADWDTAIILDACRYDIFSKCNRYDGQLRQATAMGSESREYFQRIFGEDTFHDIVYVTSNPYISILDEETFYNVYLDEAWRSYDIESPPNRLTEAAIRAHKKHPNKRIIVHFMQPHLPILATNWKDINNSIGSCSIGWIPTKSVSIDSVRKAYTANLNYVLDEVDNLLDCIDGRVLITADHGELLGERQWPIPIRGFDHPPSLYVDELIKVPWILIDNGPRRETKEDEPIGEIDVDEDVKEKRLAALGYLS